LQLTGAVQELTAMLRKAKNEPGTAAIS